MRIPLNPCYILHQRPYRETSLIIDVFSREYGKVALVAKGAKRQKSGMRSLLQMHQRLNISWSGKGELGTLTGVEINGELMNVSNRWLMIAFYLDELLMRLLHRHEDHPELFDAYDETLNKLARHEPEHPVLRAFEVQLLKSLGYGLVLDHDADTGKNIEPDRDYFYRVDHGPVAEQSQEISCIRVSGRVLNALGRGDYSDEALMREAKLLLHNVLKHHLGQKPLASRELYRAYVKNLQEA